MASPMQSFIANFLGLAEHRRAEDTLALQQTMARAQQLGQAQAMSQLLTDPTAREQLASFFGANIGGGAGSAVREVVMGTPASTAAQAATAQASGRAAMAGPEGAAVDRAAAITALTGMTPAGMAQGSVVEQLLTNPAISSEQRAAFVSNLVTGQTPGAFAMDQAVAGLGGDQLSRAARIANALELSPLQAEQTRQGREGLAQGWGQLGLQRELGFANLRQDERQFIVGSALQEAELGLRKRAMDLEALRASGRGAAVDPLEIQNEIFQIEKLIQQGQLNPEQRERLYLQMKNYGTQLLSLGHEWAKPLAELDPKEAAEKAFVPTFFSRIGGPQ